MPCIEFNPMVTEAGADGRGAASRRQATGPMMSIDIVIQFCGGTVSEEAKARLGEGAATEAANQKDFQHVQLQHGALRKHEIAVDIRFSHTMP